MAKAPTFANMISEGETRILAELAALKTQVAALTAPDLTPILSTTTALATSVSSLHEKLDTLLSLFSDLPTEEPPPPTADWPLTSAPTEGQLVLLSPGEKLGSQHLESVGAILRGAGMRRTIIDGQGGVDFGQRLAWGKGIIHTTRSLSLQHLGFRNAGTLGAGQGNSDGEAALYIEGAEPISVTAFSCAFDGCENGVFAPSYATPQGKTLNIIIHSCVFGREAANGLNDGRSHDVYLGGERVYIASSIFCGTSRGNTIKVRGKELILENSYIGRRNGRWIDCPGNTKVTSSGCTFVTCSQESRNAIGLFDEEDLGCAPEGQIGSWVSTNDTFIFQRWKEVIWLNGENVTAQFFTPKVFWVGAAGATPPIVEVQGPGKIIGTNPFIFGEHNRLDFLPPVPGDLMCG